VNVTTAAVQGSLLDAGSEPSVGALAGRTRRMPLRQGAWVDVRRGWMNGADALFDRLLETVEWHAERRRMYDRTVDVPRLLAFFDAQDQLPHPALAGAKQELDSHYAAELGEPFATAGLCLYRNGGDSVAWHGDTIGRGSSEDTMVAILSVGEPRALLLRPRHGPPGTRALRFELGHGDLLVMGGSTQRTWEHAVPKTARPVGPRISIQFRPRGVR
jgi:alkylated DNA repair dioxygenase AlkB